MRRTILAPAVAAMIAAGLALPAVAGSPAPPPAEPPVAAPPPAPAPMPAMRDWTGAYGGVSLGWGDLGGGVSGNGAVGGLHLGYLQDFGGFAVGGEASLGAARIDVNTGGRLEQLHRLGLRAGPTFGDAFVYVSGGAAQGRISGTGSDTGWFAGIGGEVAMDSNWSIGAEVTHHRFNDFNNTGVRVSPTTVQARVSFRF